MDDTGGMGDNVRSIFERRLQRVANAGRERGTFYAKPRKLRTLLPRWAFDVDGEMKTITCNTAEGAWRALARSYPKARAIGFVGVSL